MLGTRLQDLKKQFKEQIKEENKEITFLKETMENELASLKESFQNEITKLNLKLETDKAQHDKEVAQLTSKINELEGKIKTEEQFFAEMLLNGAKDGNRKKMSLALKMKPNVEIADSRGFTPLFYTIKKGDFEFANRLLNKKASLESRDADGKTILHIMSEEGDIIAVEFIVGKFPKDDKEAKILFSVLDSLAKLAADEKIIYIKQFISNAILFQAAKQGNVDLARKAVERGAEIDAQDDNQETALHKACYAGEIGMVTFLLENKCSITKKDKYGQIAAETTAKAEIKEKILNYQIENLTTLQSYIRGFFGLKKCDEPLKELKEKSKPLFQQWAIRGNTKSIAELANAIEEKQYAVAREIIANSSKEQVKGVADQEFRTMKIS